MAKSTAGISLWSYGETGDLHMQRRLMIAALPIVIIATLLVSEVAAQAILPVKKSKFYVGPLIACLQEGYRVIRGNEPHCPESRLRQRHIGDNGYHFRIRHLQCREQLGFAGGRGRRVPSRSSG